MQSVDSNTLSPIAAPLVPDEPLFVVEARKSGIGIDLKDWWIHRELLYFLIWRDVKIRYKQTLLGAAWAVIQPLLTMVIFYFIFGRVARIGSDGVPYPIFAFAGLLPWTFFANAVTTSGNSIVANSHVITKVYFPRMIIPVASVCAGLVDLAVAFPMLVALMFYYRVGLQLGALMLIPLVLLTVLLAVAVGMWLSAINVKYRDVKFAMPFLIQIWLYVSPIAYPSSVIPEKWRFIYSLNPMVGIVEGYRSALFSLPFNWTALAISLALTLGLLFYSSARFRKMERSFADII